MKNKNDREERKHQRQQREPSVLLDGRGERRGERYDSGQGGEKTSKGAAIAAKDKDQGLGGEGRFAQMTAYSPVRRKDQH